MKLAFSERDPVRLGAAGIGVVVLLVWLAFNLQSLPLIGGGTTYRAAFSEAGGLAPGNEVRVAGIRVGKVTSVSLDGGHVLVEFKVTEPVKLGRQTTASTQVKTVLGSKYLSLEPKGGGRLDPDVVIPLSRTTAAYDVVEAFQDLSSTIDRVDTDQLAEALDTVAATFQDTVPNVKASLDGLTRLSHAVASRDEELRELLAHSKTVTGVLADRTEQLTALVKDGRSLFDEIRARREVIHRLMVDTSRLAVQITALVRENRAEVGPALKHLNGVLTMLQENKANLDKSMERMAPFVRLFNNTIANGPWFDNYVPNLLSPGPTQVDPNKTGVGQ